MLKVNILHSLKNRIIFIIISGSVLIFLGIVSYYLNIIVKEDEKANKDKLLFETQKNSDNITSILNSYTNIAKTLTYTFEEYEQIPEQYRRSSYSNFLYKTIFKDDKILAIWTKFKPFTIDKLDSEYENTVLSTSGQFFKCYYRSKNEIFEKDINFDDELEFEMSEIISLFQNNKNIYIEAPRFNFYSESFIDTTYIISIISPVYNKSKFIGVVALDINIDYIIEDLEFSNSELYILNENSEIVYSKNKKIISKNFANIYSKLFENYNISNNLTEGNSTYIYDKYFDDKTYSQTVIFPMNFNSTNQTWACLQKFPDKSKSDTFVRTLQITILIAFSFVLLFTIGAFFIYNIFRDIIHFFKIFLTNVSKGNFRFNDKNFEKFTSIELQDIKNQIDNVSDNLGSLEKFAAELKTGNLDAEYQILSENDEIGMSLLAMKKNLKQNIIEQAEREEIEKIEKWLSDGVANFGDILRQNLGNFENLTFETISNLVRYLEAAQGAIYIYNDNDPDNVHLSLSALFAFDRRRYETKNIKLGEGLVGTCALEQKIIHLKKVPDNYMEITSGLGKSKPDTVIIVPLIYNMQIYGVLEVAKLDEFKPHQIEFAERIAESIASTLASARISSQTAVLLEKANQTYEQLQQKENELQIKYDNLAADFDRMQNIESGRTLVVNSLNEIVLNAEFDLKFRVIKINENLMKFLKQTYDDALSKNYYELFNIELAKFDEHSRRLNNLSLGFRQDYVFDVEVAGEKLWIRCLFNPVYDNRKKIIRYFLFGFDHSEFIKKENEIKKLIEETQIKAEQIEIQSQEMSNIFAELSETKNMLKASKDEYQKLSREYDKQDKRIEFYKRELEKRIERFKKIEANLKEKLSNFEKDKS